MTLHSAYKPEHTFTLEDIQGMVGKGWSPLIEALVGDLENLGWDGAIAQVKEKFGGLRFYTGSLTKEMSSVISAAEAASYKICEVCSRPGSIRTNGWVTVRCSECADRESRNI